MIKPKVFACMEPLFMMEHIHSYVMRLALSLVHFLLTSLSAASIRVMAATIPIPNTVTTIPTFVIIINWFVMHRIFLSGSCRWVLFVLIRRKLAVLPTCSVATEMYMGRSTYLENFMETP